MLWSEKNFDVNSVPFTRDSCKLGKYGWPADYIRFWALWHYGGVYLDADVEALKSIDELLDNKAFIGFENPTLVGTAIIGAEKRNPVIGALLEKFAATPFINPDGSCYSQNSIGVVSELLAEKFGVKMDNTLTKYEQITTYPKSLFYPHDDKSITSEHFFIHRLMCSWLEPGGDKMQATTQQQPLQPITIYKPSFYNHFIPYRDSFIYHNALQGGTFVLSYPEHRQVQQLFADPISFDLDDTATFQEFCEGGFFVDLSTDELALFRYRYSKEIVFNSSCHLVIVNTGQHELSAAFMEAVKKYIALVAYSKKVESLCIEWQGAHILDYFESHVQPLAEYAGEVCAAAGIPLRNQVGVSMSNNEVIHDKLYHKKGIPTHRQAVENLRRICAQNPSCSFRLTVLARPYAAADMEVFWSQFSSDEQEYINLVWQPYKQEDGKPATASAPTLPSVDSVEKNSRLWQLLLAPRLHQAVLYANGSAYMYIPRSLEEDRPQGILQEDGSVKWSEAEREKLLSHHWFENPRCRERRHLPLMVGICQKLVAPDGIACPIDNRYTTPDAVIVKEFESAQP
jgi:hypothetical protein